MHANAKNYPTVYYHDRVNPVLPGDHVTSRIVFRRRPGRVVYVPGISPFNSEFEYNNLTWVAIRTEDGYLVGTIVDPENHELRKKVRFVRRAEPDEPEAELPELPREADDQEWP